MDSLPEQVLDMILIHLSLQQLFELKTPGKDAVSSSFVMSSERCLKRKEKLIVMKESSWSRILYDDIDEDTVLIQEFFSKNFEDIIKTMPGLRYIKVPNLLQNELAFLLKNCQKLETLDATVYEFGKIQGSDDDFLKRLSQTDNILDFSSAKNLTSLTLTIEAERKYLIRPKIGPKIPEGLRILSLRYDCDFSSKSDIFSSTAIETLEELSLFGVSLNTTQNIKPAPKLTSFIHTERIHQEILTSLAMYSPFLTHLEVSFSFHDHFIFPIRTLRRAKFTSIRHDQLKEIIDKNPCLEELTLEIEDKEKEILTQQLIRLKNLVKLDLLEGRNKDFSYTDVLFFLKNRSSRNKAIELDIPVENCFRQSGNPTRRSLLKEIRLQTREGSQIYIEDWNTPPDREDQYDTYYYNEVGDYVPYYD